MRLIGSKEYPAVPSLKLAQVPQAHLPGTPFIPLPLLPLVTKGQRPSSIGGCGGHQYGAVIIQAKVTQGHQPPPPFIPPLRPSSIGGCESRQCGAVVIQAQVTQGRCADIAAGRGVTRLEEGGGR